MASTTMTSDKGYRTTMSVTASLSGKTQDNTREVKASATISFLDSAYGSYAYAPVTYVLQINGTTVDSWAPTRVERTSYSMSGSLYVTAGQTITVKMYAYISWSGADFSYPPNPDNGGSSVTYSITLPPLVSSITDSSISFNVEDVFSLTITKPNSNFTDILKINMQIDESTSILIKSISNYKTGNNIFFTSSELSEIYSYFGLNATPIFKFQITTMYNGETIGTSSIVTGTGKVCGNAYVKVSDSWKKGMIWIKVNETWKRAVLNTKVSETWERGQ